MNNDYNQNDGISKSLLPLNATQLLKDLENSSLKATALKALNRHVTNPDLAPNHILPWLAFAMSVDDWNDNWPGDVKRNIIKSSVQIHKKKGTVGALKFALEAFNYENITVEEWFVYGGDPYFFRVFFNVTQPGFDVNILSDIKKVIDNTKNARSRLESFKPYLSSGTAISSLASFFISKEITTINPLI
jgi:phage tail P2-like protein